MKKLLSLFLITVLVLTGLCPLTAHAASGSLAVSASSANVTVGSTVTVTLNYSGGGAKIAAIEPQISYNATAFEYVSCTGAAANGGAGVVRMSYYATGEATTSVTITLNFKAIAAGAGNFSVTTSEFYNDEDYSSLGTPSKTVSVSAINPTKSANANLSSIKPSAGTLTPAFKPEVTNYAIEVAYTTTSLSLSVTTQDKDAKTSVSGSNKLAVGKNTQTITVTAPNGTTKKYTVVITRLAKQTTTTTTAKPTTTTASPTSNQPQTSVTTTTTTVPEPQEDPLEVSVDGVLMTISDTQPDAALPEGFTWTFVSINQVDVSAAVNDTLGITLVYLTNSLDDTSAFYIYDEEQELFRILCPLKVVGGEYILHDMPADITAPVGTVAGTRIFDTIERGVWLFEDTALDNVCLVYATSPAGKTGLYMYDSEDGSMQFYREITIAADVPTTQPTEPEQTGAFAQFVTQNRSVILICAAVAGGLALLIAAVILFIFVTRRDKNCKH